jgi:hypothetical protein
VPHRRRTSSERLAVGDGRGAADGGSASQVDAAPPSADGPGGERLRLAPIVGAVVFVVASVVAARAAVRLTDIVGLVLFAAAAAWLLWPVQTRLRRRIGTGGATTVLVFGALAVALAVGALLLRDLRGASDALVERLERLDAAGGESWTDRVRRSLRIGEGVSNWVSSLPGSVVADEAGSPAIGRRVVDLIVVIVLTGFFLVGGPTVITALVGRWPRSEREQVWTLLRDIDHRGGGYLRRTSVTMAACASVVALVVWAIGCPRPSRSACGRLLAVGAHGRLDRRWCARGVGRARGGAVAGGGVDRPRDHVGPRHPLAALPASGLVATRRGRGDGVPRHRCRRERRCPRTVARRLRRGGHDGRDVAGPCPDPDAAPRPSVDRPRSRGPARWRGRCRVGVRDPDRDRRGDHHGRPRIERGGVDRDRAADRGGGRTAGGFARPPLGGCPGAWRRVRSCSGRRPCSCRCWRRWWRRGPTPHRVR